MCPSLQVRNTKYYPSLFFWYLSSIFLTVQRNRRCEAPSNRGCGQPRVDFFFSRVALCFDDDYCKDDDHLYISCWCTFWLSVTTNDHLVFSRVSVCLSATIKPHFIERRVCLFVCHVLSLLSWAEFLSVCLSSFILTSWVECLSFCLSCFILTFLRGSSLFFFCLVYQWPSVCLSATFYPHFLEQGVCLFFCHVLSSFSRWGLRCIPQSLYDRMCLPVC